MSNEEAERFMEWVKSRAPQPKREWVGLTAEDMNELDEYGQYALDVALLVEARLKEKNT